MHDPVMNYKTSWWLWAYVMTSRRHFPRILTYTHHSLRTFGVRNLISSRAQLFCFFVCLFFVCLFLLFLLIVSRLKTEKPPTPPPSCWLLVDSPLQGPVMRKVCLWDDIILINVSFVNSEALDMFYNCRCRALSNVVLYCLCYLWTTRNATQMKDKYSP